MSDTHFKKKKGDSSSSNKAIIEATNRAGFAYADGIDWLACLLAHAAAAAIARVLSKTPSLAALPALSRKLVVKRLTINHVALAGKERKCCVRGITKRNKS
jgi:hypothetical protein